MTATQIIEMFNLQPHPEGGYYKRIFESDETLSQEVLPPAFTGNRPYMSSIYYLLERGQLSSFHKLKQCELWHLYKGGPLKVYRIDTAGNLDVSIVGQDYLSGQVPHIEFQPGTYFSAELCEEGEYAFMGCSVSPGFDFKDFHLPSAAELTSKFPTHADLIHRMTKQ